MSLLIALGLIAAGFVGGVLVARAWCQARITYINAFRLAAETEAQHLQQRNAVLELQLMRIGEEHPDLVVAVANRRNGHA